MSEVQDSGVVRAPDVVDVPTTEDLKDEILRKHRERPGYVTVREQVTHSPFGSRPTAGSTVSYSCLLSSREQTYSRQTRATIQSRQLDLGWFGDRPHEVGEIVVRNDEGRFERNPTEEQSRDLLTQSVMLSCGGVPFAEVFPGRSVRFMPIDPGSLTVQSRSGEVEYTLYVFPR